MPNDPKLSNPKQFAAADKIPFHLWPETATIYGALALLDGALKYGRANWRPAGVRASVYVDAARRHVTRWFEGEQADPDSGLPHLGHALACLAILVDAEAAGVLEDDRQYPGGFHEMLKVMTPHVARLREKYADKSPKHYTIINRPFPVNPYLPPGYLERMTALDNERKVASVQTLAARADDDLHADMARLDVPAQSCCSASRKVLSECHCASAQGDGDPGVKRYICSHCHAAVYMDLSHTIRNSKDSSRHVCVSAE